VTQSRGHMKKQLIFLDTFAPSRYQGWSNDNVFLSLCNQP